MFGPNLKGIEIYFFLSGIITYDRMYVFFGPAVMGSDLFFPAKPFLFSSIFHKFQTRLSSFDGARRGNKGVDHNDRRLETTTVDFI